MPKRRRRSFTPQFKAQVVLEALAGLKSPSEIARQISRSGYSADSVRTTRRRASGPRGARPRLFLRLPAPW